MQQFFSNFDFTRKIRFWLFRYHWDADDYSTYLSVQRICRFIGLFLLLPLLSKIMKLPDAFIATVGTLFTIMAYLMMAFGPSSWDYSTDPDVLMYISAALMFNSLITVTIRSQCTKEVEKSEIGRIFSVVALGQAIVPLVSNPLFGMIYKWTLDTSLPGAYLLCIVVMLVFVMGSGILMSCHEFQSRRSTASLSFTSVTDEWIIKDFLIDSNLKGWKQLKRFSYKIQKK